MSTPLIGGRGALSLFDESGEQGVYRSPPKKNKKNGVAQVGRQVWRPTVQGYTIPVCKDSANECRICQACLSIYAECSLSSAKIIKKTRHDAQNREENDVFEDERYDMSEFLPKFALVYPRRVSLPLRRCLPLPEAMRGGVRGMAHVSKKGRGMASWG